MELTSVKIFSWIQILQFASTIDTAIQVNQKLENRVISSSDFHSSFQKHESPPQNIPHFLILYTTNISCNLRDYLIFHKRKQ